jgi:hypothetical protein
MNQRERLLSIVVGGLLAAFVISWGFGKYRSALNSRRQALAAKTNEQNLIFEQLIRGETANRYMGEYLVRSLPANPERAKSIYKQWLLETVESNEISAAKVSANTSRSIGGLYQRMDFRVNGQTTIPNFVELLHDFYARDYLHRIRNFSVQPTGDGEFKIDISIDAIALLDAPRELPMRDGTSWRVHPEIATYQDKILNRNLFEPPNQSPKYNGDTVVETVLGSSTPTPLTFEDPEGNSIRYKFTQPPPGFVKLDENSGMLTVATEEKQEFEIHVRATDNGYPNRSLDQKLTVKIVDPPPKPEPSQPTPDFDEASQTVLTALVQGRDEWTAWMHVRTRGKTLRLKVGDRFEIGSVKGIVVDVTPKYAMLEINGSKFKLQPAGTLSDAAKDPEAAQSEPDQPESEERQPTAEQSGQ